MSFSDWLTTCEATLTLYTTVRLHHEPTGTHRSVLIGKGQRLRHHETYRPGDERRCIDWKASRKDRTLLLRRFEAEKRLDVLVLFDVSASMQFGRYLSKHRIALDCAGLLGLATLRQGNAFGLVAFADQIVAYFPPRQQREAVLQRLAYLWSYAPPHATTMPTRLAPVLQHVPAQRPSLVCILSDFRLSDWQEALSTLSATHDLIAVVIDDEAEMSLEALGSIVVGDLESDHLITLDTASSAYRHAYRKQMLAARASREQILQRWCGTQYIVASQGTDYRGDLLRLFLARTAHSRGRRP